MKATLLVLVATSLLVVGCGQAATPVAATSQVDAGPPGDDHDARSATILAVERTLAQAPLPSGAREATADEAAGKQVAYHPLDDNLVDRHRTFVVPMAYSQALSWFEDHVPPQLESNGTSSASSPDRFSAGVEFERKGTWAYSSMSEQVDVYPLDDGHAVARIDALAVWLHQPTADERVPADATAVHVLQVLGAGAPGRRFTLTGPDLRRLARVVNQQRPTSSPQFVNCGNSDGSHDVLRFTGGSRELVFRVDEFGCSFMTVEVDGVTQPGLTGGFAVDQALRGILADRRPS